MLRRVFLKSAGAAAGLSALPRAAVSAARPEFSDGFVLLRSQSDAAGAAMRPFALSDCEDCDGQSVRVQIDEWQPALDGAVVSTLELRAVFALPDGSEAPFLAWHYAADGLAGSRSYATQFVAGRASLRRFDLSYRRCAGGEAMSASCGLTRLDLPLLSPGHYVLVGPDAQGERLRARTLVHSGDRQAPIERSALPAHDYLAFRISAGA